MATLIKPESYFDDVLPIESVPYFNRRTGAFSYWDRLDTDRVEQDTFTFISGALWDNGRNAKMKLQLSVHPDRFPMAHIGNITTFARNDKTKAFRRQLKQAYGSGRRDDVPYYLWHSKNVEKFINNNSDHVFEVQTGIPVSSSNKNNPLAAVHMKNAMVSILRYNDSVAAAIISIGRFSKAYVFNEFDQEECKRKLKGNATHPDMVFHDNRESDMDEEV